VVDDFVENRVFAADALGFLSDPIRHNHQPGYVDWTRTSQPFRDCLQLGKFVVKLYYQVAFSICAIARLLSVYLDYIIYYLFKTSFVIVAPRERVA
jgi:hypothetical protein